MITEADIPPEVEEALKTALREMRLRPGWAKEVIAKTINAWGGEIQDDNQWPVRTVNLVLPLSAEGRA